MKVLLTAGTFDLNGGKKSGLIEKMYLKLKDCKIIIHKRNIQHALVSN